MLAVGVHPKVASERLGHHSTAFTLDVYTHVVPSMQQQAAETVAGLILPTEPPGTGHTLDSDDASNGLER